MDGKKHIVILGSGLGGLICGYILSRDGYPITVVEQHHTEGGCLQSFVRGGVKFDTGMHYVGAMGQGGVLNKFWRYLGLLDKIKLQELDRNGFEHIHIAGKEYRYGSRADNFVDQLCTQFPDQRENLTKYVDRIEHIASLSMFYGDHRKSDGLKDNEYMTLSINQFLDQITDDEELKNVLIGNILLFAGQKGVTPMYINALINRSYIEGAYRIVGGSDAIAKALCQGITQCGGQVLTKAKVVEIVAHQNHIERVVLSDGRQIVGDSFISNIHPATTLAMIGGDTMRKTYRDRIVKARNTRSVFTLYLVFKPNTVAYQRYNYYHHSQADVWSSAECSGENFAQSYFYMHQCEEEDQQYARSAVLMAFMDYDDVRQWADVKNRKADSSYVEFVDQCAEVLLAKLEERFVGIRANIDSHYTSTPLTHADYTATPQGSIYGTELDVSQAMGGVILHRTKIDNLFFVGQNTYAHGMLGVVIGAVIACGEFMNLNEMIDNIKKQ